MIVCRQCGVTLAVAVAFCPACGGAQTPAAPSAASPPSFAPPPAPAAPPPAAGPTPWAAAPGPGAWGGPPPAAPAPGSSGGFQQMLADIRGFDFKWVVPFDTALSPALLRNPTVWVMLAFGFYPLLAMPMGYIEDMSDVARTLLIYCAMAWAGYFYYFVCKRSVDYRIGAAIMLFTAFIGARFVLVMWKVPPFTYLYHLQDPERDLISRAIGFTFGTGLIEELVKAAPVLIVAYGMRKIEKPMDGIFFGAMSGLGFGIAEGVVYILNPTSNVVSVLLRLTTLPFIHALWAGIVGYFIGLAQINKARGAALVVIGYAVAVITHGLYDALDGIPSLAVAAFTWLIFSAYLERSQHMVIELAEAERKASRESTLQQIFRETYLPGLRGAASRPAGGEG